MEPSNSLRLAVVAICLVITAHSSRLGPHHAKKLSNSHNNGVANQIVSKVNPQLKKICDQTDHADLCVATVAPLAKKTDVDSVLQVAVQAGSTYAQQALAEAEKLINNPGTSKTLLATYKDCQDGYDTAAENFQKTLDAFASNDLGTMRTMLSAVITFVGDCQDEFAEMQMESPLSTYADQLTEMASNCLAITELKM